MGKELDRRKFVRDLTSLGGAALTLGATGLLTQSCRTAGSDQTSASGDSGVMAIPAFAPTVVRDSAANPSNKNVAYYATAIAAMKVTPFPYPIPDEHGRLISTDWWEAHALIHMNNCPHGNWFFLPWHRAYLVFFERVIRRFCGVNSFALPYWNWSADGRLPAIFWSDPVLKHPLPSPNPRFYATRLLKSTESLPAWATDKVAVEGIVAINDFISFGGGRSSTTRSAGGGTGQLEGTPHNTAHSRINGDMGGFLSPRDPIFWMHHCNVDRLWSIWQNRQLAKGRSTLPSPPSRAEAAYTSDYWLKQDLGNFYDAATGAKATMTIKETQDISRLYYSYADGGAVVKAGTSLTQDIPIAQADPTSIQNVPTSQIMVNLVQKMTVHKDKKSILFSIQRTQDLMHLLALCKSRMNLPDSLQPNIRLIAKDVPLPAHPETTSLGIFVQYDWGAKPTTEVKIGTHAFFAHGHEHGGQGKQVVTIIFDLFEALKTLAAAGHDLAEGKGPIQLRVDVTSQNDFPNIAIFNDIALSIEYDQYD